MKHKRYIVIIYTDPASPVIMQDFTGRPVVMDDYGTASKERDRYGATALIADYTA